MKTATATPTIDAFDPRLMAVTRAVNKHHCHLLNYLHRLTRQHQDAENLLQDLWVYVLRNFEENQIDSLPLLRRKARQLFIDHYRRQVRRGEVLSEKLPDMPTPPIPYSDASDSNERTLQENFWMEFPTVSLTAQKKEVLWLHARYGFTYKEIEARIGVASSTIGDWISEARQQLAAALNAESKLTP